MANFILKGYQKPLYRKKNDFTRDELQLEFYRETYELIKNRRQFDVNPILRKVRMSNLLEYIKRERNRCKNKNADHKYAKPKVKIKTDIDLKREQWLEARQIGNNFSKMNKFTKTEPRPGSGPKKVTITTHKEKTMQKTKNFGNIWSLLNVIKIHLPRKNKREELLKKRRCTFEYGKYYSLRNKLYLKETMGEYDDEYQNLLEKCVDFEKDHLNIRGFLEEKLYSSFYGQLSARYKNNITQTDISIDKVTIGVQVDMDADDSPPEKKEDPPESSSNKSDNTDDPGNNVCTNTTDIGSTSNFASSNDRTENPQNYDASTKNVDEKSKPFINFSEAVESIGQSLENAVFDITAKEDASSDKLKLLISDLFLAFGLNLVKSAVGGDTLNEDANMEALDDQAMICSCLLKNKHFKVDG